MHGHVHISHISKGAGKTAGGHVQYITGRGEHAARQDVVHTAHGNLPAWAKEDALTYFQAADRYTPAPPETAQRHPRLATTSILALPQGRQGTEVLRPAQHAAMADDLARVALPTQPYVLAVHHPQDAQAPDWNPHVHLTWSPKVDDGHTREAAQWFRRHNTAHPERGGAPLDRGRTSMQGLYTLRQAFSDVINVHLEAAGRQATYYLGRLKAQHIGRPTESRHAGYVGKADTQTWSQLLQARALRAGVQFRETQLLLSRWLARTKELGLEAGMSLGDKIGRIRDWALTLASAQDQARSHTQWERFARQHPGDNPVVIPFGKYRQEPIGRLAADPQYGAWVLQQPWVHERYPQFAQMAARIQAAYEASPLRDQHGAQVHRAWERETPPGQHVGTRPGPGRLAPLAERATYAPQRPARQPGPDRER